MVLMVTKYVFLEIQNSITKFFLFHILIWRTDRYFDQGCITGLHGNIFLSFFFYEIRPWVGEGISALLKRHNPTNYTSQRNNEKMNLFLFHFCTQLDNMTRSCVIWLFMRYILNDPIPMNRNHTKSMAICKIYKLPLGPFIKQPTFLCQLPVYQDLC